MASPAERLRAAPDPDSGPAPAFEGHVGSFRVEVHADAEGGSVVLCPSEGEALRITIQGDTLSLHFAGPRVRLEAPAADMTLAARNVHIRADESFTVEAHREVDIHSRADIEVRADHHVNLWGHGVLVGD